MSASPRIQSFRKSLADPATPASAIFEIVSQTNDPKCLWLAANNPNTSLEALGNIGHRINWTSLRVIDAVIRHPNANYNLWSSVLSSFYACLPRKTLDYMWDHGCRFPNETISLQIRLVDAYRSTAYIAKSYHAMYDWDSRVIGNLECPASILRKFTPISKCVDNLITHPNVTVAILIKIYREHGGFSPWQVQLVLKQKAKFKSFPKWLEVALNMPSF